MWWRFCWIQGKKKKMQYFCCSVLLKKISGDHMNEICTTQKTKQTKKKTGQQSEPNSCSLQSRNHRKFLNPCRCCRLYVWHMYETHRSDPDHQEHLLLSPPSFLFLLCPRRDGRLSATPVIHTTARRVSTSHCSELTAAAMEEKNTTRLCFLLSFHPKPQERLHKLSLFTLPVKCYWSFM